MLQSRLSSGCQSQKQTAVREIRRRQDESHARNHDSSQVGVPFSLFMNNDQVYNYTVTECVHALQQGVRYSLVTVYS